MIQPDLPEDASICFTALHFQQEVMLKSELRGFTLPQLENQRAYKNRAECNRLQSVN